MLSIVVVARHCRRLGLRSWSSIRITWELCLSVQWSTTVFDHDPKLFTKHTSITIFVQSQSTSETFKIIAIILIHNYRQLVTKLLGLQSQSDLIMIAIISCCMDELEVCVHIFRAQSRNLDNSNNSLCFLDNRLSLHKGYFFCVTIQFISVGWIPLTLPQRLPWNLQPSVDNLDKYFINKFSN